MADLTRGAEPGEAAPPLADMRVVDGMELAGVCNRESRPLEGTAELGVKGTANCEG